MTQEFEDIRPYQDDEVQTVLKRLRADPALLDMVGKARAGGLHERFPGLVRTATRAYLRWRFARVTTVDEFQQGIAPFVVQLLENTTTSVTWAGLDNLAPGRACLFLSNHRDIVSDPAIVNYILYHQSVGTARIAIGDNLMEDPLVADLMRLNKSFIVRRNLSNPREMRNTYLNLSAFIHRSVTEGHFVWLAQREGRAKDGIDRTDPAILKMLYMSQKKTAPDFATAMENLNIVPVSIAYEYDPCDHFKAREMEERDRTGTYEKAPGEDVASIVQGIRGHKGQVHVSFGKPFKGPADTPQEAAASIDDQIRSQYHLFPSNWMAARKLSAMRDEPFTIPDLPGLDKPRLQAASDELDARLAQCALPLHPYLLALYANPVYRHPLFANGR